MEVLIEFLCPGGLVADRRRGGMHLLEVSERGLPIVAALCPGRGM